MLSLKLTSWSWLVALGFAACSANSSGGLRREPAANGASGAAGTGGGEVAVPGLDAGPAVSIDSGGGGEQATMPEVPDPGSRSARYGAVPDDIEDRFDAAQPADDGGLPSLVYPAPETMFPPDLARILFQWRAPIGSWYRLRFAFPKNTFDVYTDGQHADCTAAGTPAGSDGRCWESTVDDLGLDFAFEKGESFTLEIAALDDTDQGEPTLRVSKSYTLHVGPQPTLGAIYYWSTTAKGVRRATLEGKKPADYLTPTTGLSAAQAAALTPEQADARCVACHTLSRSGKKMMVSLQGDQLGVVDVTESLPPPFSYASLSSGAYGSDAVIGASWATFSPDENRIITASNGYLKLRDISVAHQAPVITDLALPNSGGVDYFGSMPDWAPDGKHVVFTATPGDLPTATQARHLRGSSIAWLSVEGDQFGDFELIAESNGVLTSDCIDNGGPGGVGRESFANPMFSPNSQWLLFSRGDCESERDPSAEILLAAAEPGAAFEHLLRANSQVGEVQLSNLTNAMPTWGPVFDAETKIAWIAFTSTRDFGFVLAPYSSWLSEIGYPVRQLWIAAIDVSKLGSGEDASYPAFRLPAQDYDENNHRPFWTFDELPPDFEHDDPPVVK